MTTACLRKALGVILLAIIFAVWFYYPRLVPPAERGDTDGKVRAQQGQYGDMYGGLNTLFSGLAFAGVIVALWFQFEEQSRQEKSLGDQAKQNVFATQISTVSALLDSCNSRISQLEAKKLAYGNSAIPKTRARLKELKIRRISLEIELKNLLKKVGVDTPQPEQEELDDADL